MHTSSEIKDKSYNTSYTSYTVVSVAITKHFFTKYFTLNTFFEKSTRTKYFVISVFSTYKFYKKYLYRKNNFAATSFSTSVERLFSEAILFLTTRRNRLSDSLFYSLLLIKFNSFQ